MSTGAAQTMLTDLIYRRSAGCARPLSKSELRALGPIVDEFAVSAMLACSYASIVLARASGRQVHILGPADAYKPGPAVVFHHAIMLLVQSSIPADFIATLQEYYMRVQFAAAISPGASRDGASGAGASGSGEPALDRVAWTELAHFWQTLCGTAIVAVQFLREIDAGRQLEQVDHLAVLEQRLCAIRNGETPCVRADGTAFVPDWIDNRRERRSAISFQVSIEVAGILQPGVVTNISRSGMGITSAPAPPPGSPILIRLGQQRVLAGFVKWTEGNRCGALLLVPLASDDPLLRGVTPQTVQ